MPRPDDRKPARSLILGVSLLYLAIVTCWLLVLPPFEGPDELHHYDYARYVAVTGHLPDRVPTVINEGGWYTGLWVHEGLYYWAYGQALRLLDAESVPIEAIANSRAIFNGGPEVPLLIHATPLSPGLARGVVVGRVANALCGLGTVICVFLALAHANAGPSASGLERGAGREREGQAIAALGAGCLALVPEFGVRHAFISNDPLSTFFASLAAMLALRWSPYGRDRHAAAAGQAAGGVLAGPGGRSFGRSPVLHAALIGAAAGCAVATKLTAGVIVLMMPIVFWMAWREAGARRTRAGSPESRSLRPVLVRAALAWTAGLIATGAWPFVRNWVVFGDPLALRLKHAIVAHVGSKAMFDLADPGAYVEIVRLLFRSFWVTVGWAGFRPAVPWIWWVYGAWTLVCTAAFVVAIAAIVRRRSRLRLASASAVRDDGVAPASARGGHESTPSPDVMPASRTSLTAASARAVAIAAIIVGVNLLAFVLSVSRFPGYSARYLLPITVPAVIVVAAGLRAIASAVRPRIGDTAIAWTIWASIVALALAWVATMREVVLAYHFGWTP